MVGLRLFELPRPLRVYLSNGAAHATALCATNRHWKGADDMALKGTVKVILGLMAAAVVCVVLARDSMVSAQQRPAPEPARTDVNAALLAEVRGLRADLAQSNQAGLRAQLLVARVQLQEQRIMYFDRRRADLAARTADAAEKTRQASADLKDAEERLRQIRGGGGQATGGTPPLNTLIPKEQLASVLAMFEEQIKKNQADAQAAFELEQRLRNEEADVLAVLAAEQGRWNDFNARLDELERALPK